MGNLWNVQATEGRTACPLLLTWDAGAETGSGETSELQPAHLLLQMMVKNGLCVCEEKKGKMGRRKEGRREERGKRKEGRRDRKREREREKKVKRRKKVLFIEASCLGLGASSPSSCYFMPATPPPPLAQVQLSVDFSASESVRLILSMINCQRHGWPYGTEKASSNSYFCM